MSRPHTSKLTPAHSRILHAIAHQVKRGQPVLISELVSTLSLAGVTSLMPTLRIMQRNGFIEIQGGGKRGRRCIVTLSERGKAVACVGGLRVIGSIPAGPLAEVLNQCESVIEDRDLLPYQTGDFLLVVDGDSMIGDGILPGDKVLLRPGVRIQHGEIAAVHVSDEYLATIKHVHFGPGRDKITLKASNPAYQDILVAARNVQVAGVYRGLVRTARPHR